MRIYCRKHPRYAAKTRKIKRYCATCHLLFILRWQATKKAEEKLGGLNPYQFLAESIEECCGDLVVGEQT